MLHHEKAVHTLTICAVIPLCSAVASLCSRLPSQPIRGHITVVCRYNIRLSSTEGLAQLMLAINGCTLSKTLQAGFAAVIHISETICVRLCVRPAADVMTERMQKRKGDHSQHLSSIMMHCIENILQSCHMSLI